MISQNLVGAALFGGIVLGGFVILDRSPAIQMEYYRAVTPEAHIGDDAIFEYSVKRRKSCVTRAQGVIFDGWNKEHRYPADERVFGPAADEPEQKKVAVTLNSPPAETGGAFEPGPSFRRLTLLAYCNWFQRLINWPLVQVYDIDFTILPARPA